MATRCQIKVAGEKTLLYKHFDGYPEGVLPTLNATLHWFKEDRGFFDGPYLLARLTQAFANEFDGQSRGPRSSLGIGLDTALHGDIEYLYTVNKNFTVTIKEF
jgi:hypothetical protein